MSTSVMPAASSPFHAGEQQMQSLAGMRERMADVGPRVVRDHMPDQHRDFFAQLPFMVIGSLDGAGHPCASVIAGPPGFATSPDPRSLRLDAGLLPGDPLASGWHAGAPVGLLGIQPHTRRRNRMNGVLSGVDASGANIAVRQSFGNCPKYIQPREARWRPHGLADVPSGPLPALQEGPGALLSHAASAIVGQADTVFIASASAHPLDPDAASTEGVDVSHRGGLSGFVRLSQAGEGAEAHTLLTLPDYTGNFMFNTLGNILVNPRVGLLFIDFDSGALLWLQGMAHVDHDSPEQASHEGALRLVRVRVTGASLHPQGWPLTWT